MIKMHRYECKACGHEWGQENYFNPETCPYCGSTENEMTGTYSTLDLRRWQQGRLLDTPITNRWSMAQRERADLLEKKTVCVDFSEEDHGVSRNILAVCESVISAQRIIDIHNTVLDELERVRKELDRYVGKDRPDAERAHVPADWFKDYSLETWFPLTAEKIKRDKEEYEALRAAVIEHISDGHHIGPRSEKLRNAVGLK